MLLFAISLVIGLGCPVLVSLQHQMLRGTCCHSKAKVEADTRIKNEILLAVKTVVNSLTKRNLISDV